MRFVVLLRTLRKLRTGIGERRFWVLDEEKNKPPAYSWSQFKTPRLGMCMIEKRDAIANPKSKTVGFLYFAALTNNNPPAPKPKKFGNQAAINGERMPDRPNASAINLNK
jgi:hypothetical protein